MNERSEGPSRRTRVALVYVIVFGTAIVGVLACATVLTLRSLNHEAAQINATQTETDRKLTQIENQLGIDKSGVGLAFKVFIDVNGVARFADDTKPLPVTNKHGDPLILEVLPNSPALAAGIAAGDSVKAVNGKPVKGWSTDRVVDAIRGDSGTRVTLTIVSDGTPRNVVLTRGPIGGMR